MTLWIVAPFSTVRGDEDALNRAAEDVVIPQQKFVHKRCVGIVFDGGSQRDTGVHGDVPARPPEAETVDQVQGDGHIVWIDSNHLIMDLTVVDVAVRKVDLAGVDTVRNHRCVVYRALAISDFDEGAVVLIAYLAGRERLWGELGAFGSGHEVVFWSEIDRTLIEYDVPICIQVTSSRSGVSEVQLRGVV